MDMKQKYVKCSKRCTPHSVAAWVGAEGTDPVALMLSGTN